MKNFSFTNSIDFNLLHLLKHLKPTCETNLGAFKSTIHVDSKALFPMKNNSVSGWNVKLFKFTQFKKAFITMNFTCWGSTKEPIAVCSKALLSTVVKDELSSNWTPLKLMQSPKANAFITFTTYGIKTAILSLHAKTIVSKASSPGTDFLSMTFGCPWRHLKFWFWGDKATDLREDVPAHQQ